MKSLTQCLINESVGRGNGQFRLGPEMLNNEDIVVVDILLECLRDKKINLEEMAKYYKEKLAKKYEQDEDDPLNLTKLVDESVKYCRVGNVESKFRSIVDSICYPA